MSETLDLRDPLRLYKFILANKMAYKRMIKSQDTELHDLIMRKYTSTKNSAENFWLHCHGCTEPPKCECGKHLRFTNIVEGYKSKECKQCYEKNRVKNSKLNKTLTTQPSDAPECKNTNCSQPVMKRKDNTWGDYCSVRCRGQHNSLKSRNKSKQTCNDRYGVDHPLQSPAILTRMQQHLQSKYNVSNVAHIADVKAKIAKTCMERYGTENAFQNEDVRAKHLLNIQNKYGSNIQNISQIPGVQEKKMRSSHLSKYYSMPSGYQQRVQGYEDKFLDAALAYYDETWLKFGCSIPYQDNTCVYYPDVVLTTTNIVIEVKSDYTFYADYEKNMKKAIGVNESGNDIVFVIYANNGTVYNVQAITPERNRLCSYLNSLNIDVKQHTQFGNYIVDFYMPQTNSAILVRHHDFTDETFVNSAYYKTMNGYFASIGINLYIVYNHAITDKWINGITSKLQKVSTPSIYARKCTVKSVGKESYVFLNANHIQGFAPCTIKYGLYYNDELVALMSFNKFRRGIGKDRGDNAYELVRYATSSRVVGGASKLIKHFVKQHNPDIIYSYSDNTISSGNMYSAIGFELEKDSNPDYAYNMHGDTTIHHRFSFRKGALREKLDYYDETKSERELMKMNGYRRLYDAGKKTWVLNFSVSDT